MTANVSNDGDNGQFVKVITADQFEVSVPMDIALMAKTLVELLDVYDSKPIPLTDVSKETLEQIMEWCEKHKSDKAEVVDLEDEEPGTGINLESVGAAVTAATAEPEEEEKPAYENIDPWDKEFLTTKVSKYDVFDLLKASHYLQIELLRTCCAKIVASWIAGKTIEEVRTMKIGEVKPWNVPQSKKGSKGQSSKRSGRGGKSKGKK